LKDNSEKTSLRKFLLDKRDGTSFDLMKIISKAIQKRLKKIDSFRNAKK